MDSYLNLAKISFKEYLQTGKIPAVPKNVPKELLQKKAGVFICFKNKGQLRGCIGTFLPFYENIAQEIINNTIAAATEDPRFLPIKEDELPDLKLSIDVLSEPQLVNNEDLNKLDAKKFGILVKSIDQQKSGLLLPDLEGVDTPSQQIVIACQKAGIHYLTDKFSVYKFTVERHEER